MDRWSRTAGTIAARLFLRAASISLAFVKSLRVRCETGRRSSASPLTSGFGTGWTNLPELTSFDFNLEDFRALPIAQRRDFLASLTSDEVDALLAAWEFTGRRDQMPPPGGWATWVCQAGRGFGKTRLGSEWIRHRVKDGSRRICLLAKDLDDAVKVMIEGESGILNSCHPDDRTYDGVRIGVPRVTLSGGRGRVITWENGAIAQWFSAEDPDDLRGPQFDTAWADELAKWKKPAEPWDMLQFALRLGDDPRVLVTTTPRPVQTFIDILEDPTTVVTTGSTFANKANLSGKFIDRIKAKYAGTRLGAQELQGALLTDVVGAIFPTDVIDAHRVRERNLPRLVRVVVAVDPSGAADARSASDEIGIVVAGIDEADHAYVLADYSLTGGPPEWSRQVLKAFDDWEADLIVAESNYGGAMVEYTIKSARKNAPVRMVSASRGKVQRAEPIALFYERGEVHHLIPDRLEDPTGLDVVEAQLSRFTVKGYEGSGSPDRADAAIWALTSLLVTGGDIDFY